MKRLSGIFLFFILFSTSLKSQTADIAGEVKDNAGTLSGVVITITPEEESDVISYAITDNGGKFFLKNVDMAKAKFIRARLMGYATQAQMMDENKTEYSFLLVEESIQLNEVMIKAAKISGAGDTTRYLASSFAKENDITLGDVIKRMPGFHVTDGGTIKYQGKDISDFYVEGSNIMGAKYPVAVNSIHQGDVGSVEVIENHQSIKLFEDLLFSDKTAVNITLKERAKNKWVGLLNIGGGIRGQWSADLNAMRFGKKIKMLNTYKGNNTGNNVSAMGKPTFNLSGDVEENAREIIQMRSMGNPYLEERRTLFNQSQLLSLNNQVLLNKAFVLTPQLDLGKSSFKNDIWEERYYYLDDGETMYISTREKGMQSQWEISPTIRLEANTRKMYVNNVLTSSIVYKENDVSVTGTYPNQENSEMDYINIRNSLDVMFRMGKKVIGVKSVNSWQQRPQEMQIEENDRSINEYVKISAFNSRTSTSQSYPFGKTTISLEEGYTFSQQQLKSTLTGIDNLTYPAPFENEFDYRNALLYIKPSFSVRFGDFRTLLSMPLNYNYNNYTDERTSKTYTKNKLLLSPSTSVTWVINKKYTLSANGGWKQQPENSDNFYSSPMLSSYPYIQTGLLDYHHAETANVDVLVRYKNILDGLFWNVSYNRLWRNEDLMFTQDFENTYIISGLTRNPHTTKLDNVFANISYMLDFLKGGVSLRGIYSHSDSYFKQNGEQWYSISKMKQLSLNMYASPLSQLDINYTCSFTNNSFQPKEENNQSTNTMHQKLSLTFIPIEKLNVVINGNHYLNTLESGNKNCYLWDADVNCRFSSKWSFRLSAQNLLNQKEFSFLSYTDMMSIERTYQIRPFSLLFSVITSF
jgi:hypothetical protein